MLTIWPNKWVIKKSFWQNDDYGNLIGWYEILKKIPVLVATCHQLVNWSPCIVNEVMADSGKRLRLIVVGNFLVGCSLVGFRGKNIECWPTWFNSISVSNPTMTLILFNRYVDFKTILILFFGF